MFTTLLAAIALTTVAVPATGAAASLTIDPMSGRAASQITVHGTGFRPCTLHGLTLSWPNHEGASIDGSDLADGEFTAAVEIPGDARPGGLTLSAGCKTPTQSDAEWTVGEVVDTPSVHPSVGPRATEVILGPTKDVVGEPAVGVRGLGFDACRPDGVSLTWEGRSSASRTGVAVGVRHFETVIELPSDETGTYGLFVTCTFPAVSATFQVEPATVTTTPPTTTMPPVTAVEPPASSTSTPRTTSGARTTPPTSLPTTPTPTAATPSTSSGLGTATPGGPGSPPPTAGPTATRVAVHPVRMTERLAPPEAFDIAWRFVLATVLLAALLMILIAFPAELFNRTYEANAAEIGGLLDWITIWRVRFGRRIGVTVFLVVAAALSAILAGNEGAAGNPFAQFLAFVVAVPLVLLAYGGLAELYAGRRSRIPGRFRALPHALLIAFVCGAFSQLLQLEPPYLYGLIAGFATIAARQPTAADDGRAVLLGAGVLIGLAIASWVVWDRIHDRAYDVDPAFGWVVLDAILFWIVVLGAESLVFGLAPLRFLDGERLRSWHQLAWLVPQTVAAIFFVAVVVLRGDVSRPNVGAAGILRALGFFAIFGLASVLFWSYFRWNGRPTARRAVESQAPARPEV